MYPAHPGDPARGNKRRVELARYSLSRRSCVNVVSHRFTLANEYLSDCPDRGTVLRHERDVHESVLSIETSVAAKSQLALFIVTGVAAERRFCYTSRVIDSQTGANATPRPQAVDVHSEAFLHSLKARQLKLSLACASAFLIALLGLPLANYFWPELMAVRVFGFTLTWFVLGVLFFPFVWIISYLFIRRSIALERAEVEEASREAAKEAKE